MWHDNFADRLRAWSELRSKAESLPLHEALEEINYFWQQTPWQSYYLHWDDFAEWPDPWQLLADNVYCEVARALGIVYTISMLKRADMSDASMILTTDGFNLVTVDKNKYTLNWADEILVNSFSVVNIKRQITQDDFKKYQ